MFKISNLDRMSNFEWTTVHASPLGNFRFWIMELFPGKSRNIFQSELVKIF